MFRAMLISINESSYRNDKGVLIKGKSYVFLQYHKDRDVSTGAKNKRFVNDESDDYKHLKLEVEKYYAVDIDFESGKITNIMPWVEHKTKSVVSLTEPK